jgi:hypothetical protein
MATLAPSLTLLFAELDAAWPNRFRGTDGWFRPARYCTRPSDHCPGPDGRVRAIDFSNIRIDPDWAVQQIIKHPRVTNYVIWNRLIWSNWRNFAPATYTGTSNPHTDHVHVSILHTEHAWSWQQGWGIAAGVRINVGAAPMDRARRDVDFAGPIESIATQWRAAARTASGAATAIRRLR